MFKSKVTFVVLGVLGFVMVAIGAVALNSSETNNIQTTEEGKALSNQIDQLGMPASDNSAVDTTTTTASAVANATASEGMNAVQPVNDSTLVVQPIKEDIAETASGAPSQ